MQSPVWSSTRASARARRRSRRTAFGYGTWSSAWLCDEQLGDLVDPVGGVTLGAVVSPLYRQAGVLGGSDYAVGFDSGTSDGFHASSTSTYDLDASTSIACYACVQFTNLINRNYMGKNGPGANNWAIQFQSFPTGHVTGYVDEGAAAEVLATVAADHWQSGAGNWHDTLICIDRANQRLQVFTELGASPAVDISGEGTLTNVWPFYLGAGFSGTTGAFRIAFAAVATGDIAALRTNGAAAVANIRRFTGR